MINASVLLFGLNELINPDFLSSVHIAYWERRSWKDLSPVSKILVKCALLYPVSHPFVQIYQHLLNIYYKQCQALCLACVGVLKWDYSLLLLSCYKYSLCQSGPWPEKEYTLTLDSDENLMKGLFIEV